MKKQIIYITTIIFISCNANNVAPVNTTEKTSNTITETSQKPNTTSPQITAIFKGQTLNLVGKITTQCNANNDCNSTIMVKQKNSDNNIMYELVAVLNKQISVGTFTLTSNLFGNFIDAVNTITKGEGEYKYSTPTSYKQKGGSITFTNVTDSLVSGSFILNVYKLSDTTVTETIQGNIINLPIKAINE
ncbi:hypothetical protein ACFOWM_07610 [Ferruginibacter yonginensis]|uniref:Lipocalin-like domain-containing protein n=1 Tax=Ferruginibacter yonginensis TaxID=1310416 RepID=A0ABV8QTM4_9BACT